MAFGRKVGLPSLSCLHYNDERWERNSTHRPGNFGSCPRIWPFTRRLRVSLPGWRACWTAWGRITRAQGPTSRENRANRLWHFRVGRLQNRCKRLILQGLYIRCWTASSCENTRVVKETFIMAWTTPQFEEVMLNCEINSYASAEV